MSKHARDRRPYVKPVTKLELSESNIKLRWIAIVVLLSIAVVSIGYGFSLALRTEPGWQTVTVTTDQTNCSKDFVLMYDFGADRDGTNPTLRYKQLQTLYSELTVSAYQLFSSEAQGAGNLYYLNSHVNQRVTVAPELYRALEQIAASGSRHPYTGPVQALYTPVFLSAGDAEAILYDPAQDPELKELAQRVASYCASEEMIRLELFDDNQVQLTVAEGYLAFAREYGIGDLLDLGWMRNAFIADYMAEKLREQGFCHGYLSSYDGFTRNLDISGETYSVNFFDRQENTVLMPGRLDYSAPMSIVTLRDYPLSEEDRWHYYSYENGSITSVYLDPNDGMCKSSVDSLMGYSAEYGCVELVLRMAPVFTAEHLDREALTAAESDAVHYLWYEGTTLYHTQENSNVTLLPESGGEGYTVAFFP